MIWQDGHLKAMALYTRMGVLELLHLGQHQSELFVQITLALKFKEKWIYQVGLH